MDKIELNNDDLILIKTALDTMDTSAIFSNITKAQEVAIKQRIKQIKEKLGDTDEQ